MLLLQLFTAKTAIRVCNIKMREEIEKLREDIDKIEIRADILKNG